MTANQQSTAALPFWKKAIFTLVILVLTAAVLELSAAWYLRYSRGYDGHYLLQYEFDPYKVISPTRNFVDTRGLRHNAQGFRHPTEVAREKAPDVYRIFLMGGSSAYGTGGLWTHIDPHHPILHDSTTITAYLQEMLDGKVEGQRVEVINAAITSSWTHQHLIYLNQSVLRYQPDLVIFMDGFNDYYFFEDGHDQFDSYAYKAHASVIMGEPTLKSMVFGNAWWWSRRSAFAHLLYRQTQTVGALMRRRAPGQPIDPDSAFARLQRVFPANALRMVERIALLMSHEQVAALFVLQPLLILERDRPGADDMEQRLFDFNATAYLPGYEDFIRRAVPYVSQRVEHTAAAFGASYLDATSIYDGIEGQVYTDYAHLTPLGNKVLASHLAGLVMMQMRASGTFN
jgi:hypothetical protein